MARRVCLVAGAGRTPIADHERKAVTACAPNFYVFNGTVELQGHQQSLTFLEGADPSMSALRKAVKKKAACPHLSVSMSGARGLTSSAAGTVSA